jgi:hypothetical protein
MPVTYVGSERPRVTRDDMRNSDCPRLTNGLHAQAGHCHRCDNRIRVCQPIVYRVRDTRGRIITDDWIMVP